MIFTQEHEELRRTVRHFVDREINPHVEEWEKAGRFPIHEIFRMAGDLGLLGISKPENNFSFRPLASNNLQDKNLLYTLFSGSRTGDLGNRTSYLITTFLNPAVATSRNNAKTREAARRNYLLLDERNAGNNLGFAAITEPMPMITYAENQLTLAECATRTQGLSAGLTFLNAYRVQLNGAKLFRKLNATDELKYDPLVLEDLK